MNTKDLERLYQDVELGKIPFLTQNDEFKWSGCTMCGICCFDIDILLNPYDILRLRRHLGCTTSDLIDRGLVEIFPGGNSGLPLAMIAFRKLDEETSVCPFLAALADGDKLREVARGKKVPSRQDLQATHPDALQSERCIAAHIPSRFARSETIAGSEGSVRSSDNDKWDRPVAGSSDQSKNGVGVRFADRQSRETPRSGGACSVYPTRPTVCRSSPLGRMAVLSREGEQTRGIFYQPPTRLCPACQGEERVEVAKWIEDNGVRPYWDASERFHRLCRTMLENGLMLKDGQDHATVILWNLAAGILYDFDSLGILAREFPRNRESEDSEEDLRILSLLFRMVESIATAVPRLKEIAARGGQG